MTPEEAKKKMEERRKAQQVGAGTIDPNPASLTLKWKFFNEEVEVAGGRKARLPSGSFQFQKKQEDGTWEKFNLPQKTFAIAIIEHNIVAISGSDFDNGRLTRQYWSNEMRMQDLMVSPFILKMKGADKAEKAKTYFGTWKELKADHGLKGRMHIIYGVTPSGQLVKLILPYYSYSLGNDKFKTHGDTLLDADAKSIKAGLGGMNECYLTYDGFHEQKTGETIYTAPIFKFEEKFSDEMIVTMSEKADEFDAWYAKYHASNIAFYDKTMNGGTPTHRDETHQGESKHGAENQDAGASLHADSAFADEPECDDDDSIPF